MNASSSHFLSLHHSLLRSFPCDKDGESPSPASQVQYMQNNWLGDHSGGAFCGVTSSLLICAFPKWAAALHPGKQSWCLEHVCELRLLEWIKLSLCHLNVTISKAVMMTLKLKQRWWLFTSTVAPFPELCVLALCRLPFGLRIFIPPLRFLELFPAPPAWLQGGNGSIRTCSSVISASWVFPADSVTSCSNLVSFA